MDETSIQCFHYSFVIVNDRDSPTLTKYNILEFNVKVFETLIPYFDFLNINKMVKPQWQNYTVHAWRPTYHAAFSNVTLLMGVGRFRILGGPRFRILGGGARGGTNSQQAHDVVMTSMRRNDVASSSFRRHVPTRLLINQCQTITFLILKSDIIKNSRIELRGIVLPAP